VKAPPFFFTIDPGFLEVPLMNPHVPGNSHLFAYSAAYSCVTESRDSTGFNPIFRFCSEPSYLSEYRPAIDF
jgi:hypothetical protein